MNEWYWISIGFLFGLIGSLIITFTKYFLDARKEKKNHERKQRGKRKNIASLIIADIETKLVFIKKITPLYKRIIAKIEEFEGDKEYLALLDEAGEEFKFFYENTYNTLLPHFSILSFNTLNSVLSFYKLVRTLNSVIENAKNRKNLDMLDFVINLVYLAEHKAYFVLENLYRKYIEDLTQAEIYKNSSEELLSKHEIDES